MNTVQYLLCPMVIGNHSKAGLQGKRASGQEKTQDVWCEEKKSTRKCNFAAKVCAERDKEIKEMSDLHWNKGKGALRSRSYPSSFQFVKESLRICCCKATTNKG